MKKLVFILLLASPIITFAQKKRIVLDSTGNHGLVICDSIAYPVTWEEAYQFARDMAQFGWRLPTLKEQKAIFEKTYNAREARGIIPNGSYYASSFETNSFSNPNRPDTVPHLGQLYSVFKAVYEIDGVGKPTNRAFLVKSF